MDVLERMFRDEEEMYGLFLQEERFEDMAEIVKEADFSSYEDDHRVVQLSAQYSGWRSSSLLAFFHPSYVSSFQRVEDGEVKSWDMSIPEMDALCEAWTKFKADFEAYREAEQAKNA